MHKMRRLGRLLSPKDYESEILRYWEEKKIYDKIRESRTRSKRFYFLDGPPYPSSDTPHPGTVWNKIVKDAVVRFKRGEGYLVLDKPGWDTHGLPIEVMTEKALGFSSKKDIENFGIDKFVEKCRELASKNIESMTKHFKEFGVSLDWSSPYKTYDREYIESAWWGLKRIWEEGRLYQGERPVHWCPRCETVLSDYEVSESYKDMMDPSIFVKFKVVGRDEYLVIWTTTPWTLPANVAVMVHPDEKYVRVKTDAGVLILAEKRLEHVVRESGIKHYELLEEFQGGSLEGLRYEHPLEDIVDLQKSLKDSHKVILSSEYVTMEEGSGCVHVAPGHGREDFEMSLRYELPVRSPVDERGAFTSEAGKYAGLNVREANSLIIGDLESRGALLAKGTIIHKYPVCWRCDTPLIIRTTRQWFIKLSDIREKLLSESDSVKWVPRWGGERRFRDWLLGVGDWIISRQRYWGIPIPIWVCDSCGNLEVVGSSRELEERSGVKLEDLHRPWVDNVSFSCKSCGGNMRRIPDIMDVWYDSGVSFFASFGYPYKSREPFDEIFPADFITEGHDQVRGWFFSLLRIGVLLFGRAPYKSVLMHGFMLDERGREMHKRLGNYVPPQEIIKRHGRDCFRAFVLTKVPWQDLRFSWKGMEEMERKLNVIWNVYVFASTYIGDREVRSLDGIEVKDPINKWLISRLNTMMKNFREAMEDYSLHIAANEVINFLVEDVSHLYLRVSRRKIRSRDESVSLEWSSVLYHVLKQTLPYLSIVTPFLAEKIYLDSLKMEGDPDSVNMLPLPQPDDSLIDKELESLMEVAKMIISSSGQARANAGLKRRQPLREMIISSENPQVRRVVEKFAEVIAVEANVKSLELGSPPEGGRWSEGSFNGGKIYISLEIGEEEILEGLSREIIRRIQLMRKELGLTLGVERIEIYIQGDDAVRKAVESFYEDIAWNSDADAIHVVESAEEVSGISLGKEWEIDGRKVFIWVKKLE